MTSELYFWKDEGIKGVKIDIENRGAVFGHLIVDDIFISCPSIPDLASKLNSPMMLSSPFVNYYSYKVSDWFEFIPELIKLYCDNGSYYVDIVGKISWDGKNYDDITDINQVKQKVSVLA